MLLENILYNFLDKFKHHATTEIPMLRQICDIEKKCFLYRSQF